MTVLKRKSKKKKNEAFNKASNEAGELMSIWTDDYMQLVNAGIKLIIFNEMKSVCIEDDYGIKLKLTKASKGYIKMDRIDTNKSSITI